MYTGKDDVIVNVAMKRIILEQVMSFQYPSRLVA